MNDMALITVKDGRDGPDLVFQRPGRPALTVHCTERDLLRLAVVLLDRIRRNANDALTAIAAARKGDQA